MEVDNYNDPRRSWVTSQMGNSKLNVLLVEDDEIAAQDILQSLAQPGLSPVHQRVNTQDTFLGALRNGSWDAVISDYALPNFSGPEALRSLRQFGSDIPFIMVSGVFGEELAVAVLKAGANDYLLKSNLSRLAPTLERELEAAEERRRRQRAEGERQYLAAIVNSCEDAIYGKDLNGIIMSWNPAAERLYGYRAEEIVGQPIAVLFPPQAEVEMQAIMAAVRRDEIVGIQDTERRHKSGKLMPVSVTISPIKDVNGAIIGASAIARDITKQKAAERERQQLIETLTAKTKTIHALAGLVPICAACKRIRNDRGYWEMVEIYISEHSDAVFSHSLCPECIEQYEQKSASPE